MSHTRAVLVAWLGIAGTAVAAAVGLQEGARRQLEGAIGASADPCARAQLLVARGTIALERAVLASPAIGTRPEDAADRAEARQALSAAIAQCPNSADAHRLLARVEWLEGKRGLAYLHQGLSHVAAGEIDPAIAAFRLASLEQPNDPATIVALARTLAAAGRLAEADRAIAGRADIAAGTPGGASLLGRLEIWKGRPVEAEAFLRKALAENPADRAALRNFGDAVRAAGRAKEGAAFLFSIAGNDAAVSIDLYVIAAELCGVAGDLPAQERALRAALDFFSNSARLNFELAANLSRQGKRIAARDTYRRAVEIDRRWVEGAVRSYGIDPSQ